eukprot:jgi/Mesen1/3612/ME000020S03143
MTTRSNFYKNSAYSYVRDATLDSLISNLEAYRKATSNIPHGAAVTSPSSTAAETTPAGERDKSRRGVKRKPQHDPSCLREVRPVLGSGLRRLHNRQKRGSEREKDPPRSLVPPLQIAESTFPPAQPLVSSPLKP